MTIEIRNMLSEDWNSVSEIYLQGIQTGHATFETVAPDRVQWEKSHFAHSRITATENDLITGWAALSPVSSRCVYGGVGEVSVYVGSEHRGKGIGRKLLLALIDSSEKNGIWTLQAGIFPENIASVKLHLDCGFREVGRRERIGMMEGRWRDTLLLERRSQIVGV